MAQSLPRCPSRLRSETGQCPLRKARQLPRGQERVTRMLMSSAPVSDPCRGVGRCGVGAWQACLGVIPASSRHALPRLTHLPPVRQVPTLEGGENQNSSRSNGSGARAAPAHPASLLAGWLVAWAPHEYDKENSRFGLAWPMPCSPGARVPLYGWWPVVGEVETPDQQATMRTHPIICPCPSSVGCPGSGRADVFGDSGSGGRYATGRKPLTGLRSTVG